MFSLGSSGEAAPNSAFLRKRKAKVQGLCRRMYFTRMWKNRINSMKNKNPISIKAKSDKKAKARQVKKRKD